MTKPLITLSAIAFFSGGMMSGRFLFPISIKPAHDTSSKSPRNITRKTSASRKLSHQLDAIISLPQSDEQQKEFVATLLELVEIDPHKVLLHVSDLRDSKATNFLTWKAARILINKNPSQAFDWLEQQASGQIRNWASLAMFHESTWTQPSVAGELIPHLPTGHQQYAMTQLIPSWAAKDLPSAKNFLASIDSSALKKKGYEAIMEPWSQSNPQEALAFYEGHQNIFGVQKEDGYNGIATGWAAKKPTDALAWAAKLEDPVIKEQIEQCIKTTWSKNDPASAAQAGILDHGGEWILRDPKAARSWIESLEPQTRISVMGRTIGEVAIKDPAQAADLYLEMLPWADPSLPGSDLANAAGNLANQWAGSEPQAAIKWALALEKGQARDNALRQTAQCLVNHAPDQASTFIEQLPAGSVRNQASGYMVDQSLRDHPQVAFEWSQEIEDDALRLTKTKDIIGRYQEIQKFATAREIANQANLTEAQKSKILQNIQDDENDTPRPLTGKLEPGIGTPPR